VEITERHREPQAALGPPFNLDPFDRAVPDE
jgi:hypothetical protein